MVHIADYIEVAYNAAKVVFDNVFLSRPMAVAEKVTEYCVVTCSSTVRNKELDPSGDFNYYNATMQFHIFVKDKTNSYKTNQPDIKKISQLTSEVMQLFPVVDKEKSVMLHRPNVVLSDDNDDGWHYIYITAKLTTYISNT